MTAAVDQADRGHGRLVVGILVIGSVTWTYAVNDLATTVVPPTNERALWTLWLLDAILFVIIPVATLTALQGWGIVRVQDHYPARRWVSVLTGAVCALPMWVLFSRVIDPLIFEALPHRLTPAVPFITEPPVVRWLLVIYAAVSAGILEELVDRAIVITQLEKAGVRTLWAGGASIVITVVLHWGVGYGKWIQIAIWSVPMTIVYVRTRSVLGVTACHVTYDLLSFGEATS